ncbi:MAG: hypothetical protein EZS28_012474 [Streblomastix strix]|uniref:Uncharacterized protein n=1 Tax=Streblomastix strix TaxID=222440 RepID=A0A5J4WBR5_9EUKA|nr:MAG: hypothetical protein EZS28_012474 [Streblomastix strix]
MGRYIFELIDKLNLPIIPSKSNSIKSDFILQQRSHNIKSNGAMMAWPAMIYMLNESVKQIPYPQTFNPMLSQRTKYGKSKKYYVSSNDSNIPQVPEVEKDESSQFRYSIEQDFLEKLTCSQLMDIDSRLRDITYVH